MTQTLGPLASAATLGLEPLLSRGFQLMPGPHGGRGERVDLVSEAVLIAVSADWLEGEIEVNLQAVGGSAIPLAILVDLQRVKGPRLSRISRSVTHGQLVSIMEKIADVLVAQAPDVLAATPEGLGRLGVR